MNTQTYIVNYPVKLSDHFDIPADHSCWDGNSYKTVNGKNPYPDRKFIMKFKELLIPKTNFVKDHCTAGLYVMFFKDFKKYYVGISTSSASTETILKRLRKHRAKATGSAVKINHTNTKPFGWRTFAKQRFKKFGNQDQLNDCYLAVINLQNLQNLIGDETKQLEFIENQLSSSNHPIIKKIISSLTDENDYKNWTSFNKTSKGTKHDPHFEFKNFN